MSPGNTTAWASGLRRYYNPKAWIKILKTRWLLSLWLMAVGFGGATPLGGFQAGANPNMRKQKLT
jgi:hypothetical protein